MATHGRRPFQQQMHDTWQQTFLSRGHRPGPVPAASLRAGIVINAILQMSKTEARRGQVTFAGSLGQLGEGLGATRRQSNPQHTLPTSPRGVASLSRDTV